MSHGDIGHCRNEESGRCFGVTHGDKCVGDERRCGEVWNYCQVSLGYRML